MKWLVVFLFDLLKEKLVASLSLSKEREASSRTWLTASDRFSFTKRGTFHTLVILIWIPYPSQYCYIVTMVTSVHMSELINPSIRPIQIRYHADFPFSLGKRCSVQSLAFRCPS